MSDGNLPPGAFITSLGGKRCTAVPKQNRGNNNGNNNNNNNNNNGNNNSKNGNNNNSNNNNNNNGSQQKTTTQQQDTTTSTTEAQATTTTSEQQQQTTAIQAAPPPPPPPPPPAVVQASTTQEIQSTTSTTRSTFLSTPSPPPPPPPTFNTIPKAEAPTAIVAAPAVTTPDPEPAATPSPSSFVQIPPTSLRPSSALIPPPLPSPTVAAPSVVRSTPLAQESKTNVNPAPTISSAALAQDGQQANPNPTPQAPQSEVTPTSAQESNGANGALFTTIGQAAGLNSNGATPSTSSAAGPAAQPTISTGTTIAVAGGVIGGLAFVSIIGFLFWFWRKRSLRKRRSTLLTPLSAEPGFRDNEKGGSYEINRTSLGPTPLSEKLASIVGYKFKRLRGRYAGSPNPSVNLNRGNSQFIEPDTPRSRSGSAAGGAIVNNGGKITMKDRLRGLFGKFGGDASLKNGYGSRERPAASDMTAATMKPKTVNGQPDFLTLLSMDDKQLEAEASRRRRSQSADGIKRYSTNRNGSQDHFLGALGLNFDSSNPFSDANSMSHDSARVTPLQVSGPNNPFSDANAITAPSMAKQPTNYVQNIRRSRGQSVGGQSTRPPSTQTHGRMESIGAYRESGVSVESFQTRRNKFRSDPFDLDRPELLSNRGGNRGSNGSIVGTMPSVGAVPGVAALGNMPQPKKALVRTDSLSSKYSSGVESLSEWSDPGPDVGPAAVRRGETPDLLPRSDSKRKSGASQGSVGKAY